MIDVFNNPSNDYVNPGLAPCAGAGDDNNKFEFIDGKVCIVNGAELVQCLDLSGISVPVTSWSGQNITLQSGEITYIQGLTKGIQNRVQAFDINIYNILNQAPNQEFYFMVDLSINYYHNFKYFNDDVDATADYSLNINIEDALNIKFGDKNIDTAVIYDPSAFTFIGTKLGYDFDITNVVLTIIDASIDATSPFPSLIIDGERVPQVFILPENKAAEMSAYKYPNGAMLGYVVTATYPPDECMYDSWLYMNEVKSPFDVYLKTNLTTYVVDISIYKTLTFDPSIQWPGITADVSRNGIDINLAPTTLTPFEPSIYQDGRDGEIITGTWIEESVIIDSSISYSSIYNSALGTISVDASGIGSMIIGSTFLVSGNIDSTNTISDSSIVNSIVIDGSIDNTWLQDSNLASLNFAGGILLNVDVSNGNIWNSIMQGVSTYSTMSNSNVYDSSIKLYETTGTDFYNSYIMDSSISTGSLTSSFIFDASLGDVNISDSSIADGYIIDSSIHGTFLDGTIIEDSSILDTNLKNTIINNKVVIIDSSIENSWTNAFEVAPGLWTNDVSCTREYITGGVIHDSSINNTTLLDVSIYTSKIYDSSITGCTLYNVDLDENSIPKNSQNIYINSTCTFDSSIIVDSSTFYEKFSKKVDVGMSGNGDETTLSAGEYLDYINTHNLWDKFGPLVARISAPDRPDSNTKNLINGFYIFNPQNFPVQVDYLVIN